MIAKCRSAIALLVGAALFCLAPTPDALAEEYRVEQARDGRFFIIDGVEFQARNPCPSVQTGDFVTFLTGSPDGHCTFASFADLNSGQKCEVWCQKPLRQMP